MAFPPFQVLYHCPKGLAHSRPVLETPRHPNVANHTLLTRICLCFPTPQLFSASCSRSALLQPTHSCTLAEVNPEKLLGFSSVNCGNTTLWQLFLPVFLKIVSENQKSCALFLKYSCSRFRNNQRKFQEMESTFFTLLVVD